jgi:hypothetical protein
MSNLSKNRSAEDLAKLGIKVEVPVIEVADDAPSVDLITETDLRELSRSEKFMQDVLLVRIATTTDRNAPPFATLTVNDVNGRVQIPRGRPLPVRRYHVEVLARMRETNYTQPDQNLSNPEISNQLIPQHSWAYPFEVLRDPHPHGRAWLETILAEPTY